MVEIKSIEHNSIDTLNLTKISRRSRRQKIDID